MKKSSFQTRETLQYLFWCIMTTIVSWLTYSLFVYVLGTVMTKVTTILIANILSWICAVTFSFLANKILVFHSRSWHFKTVLPELLKFFSTRLLMGFLEMGLIFILTYAGLTQAFLGVDGMASKMIVTPVIILLNYLCGKFLVFQK